MRRSRSDSPWPKVSPPAISVGLDHSSKYIPVQTARIEIHTLESLTPTDKQFLTGFKDGIPVRISGELRLPPGTVRVPAVILVHGSAGIGANVDHWARELNGIGDRKS